MDIVVRGETEPQCPHEPTPRTRPCAMLRSVGGAAGRCAPFGVGDARTGHATGVQGTGQEGVNAECCLAAGRRWGLGTDAQQQELTTARTASSKSNFTCMCFVYPASWPPLLALIAWTCGGSAVLDPGTAGGQIQLRSPPSVTRGGDPVTPAGWGVRRRARRAGGRRGTTPAIQIRQLRVCRISAWRPSTTA